MIKKSPLASITDRIREEKEKGKNIFNLAVGEPDFEVPKYIRNGMIEKIENGGKDVDAYTETLGIKPLRQAIADRFNRCLMKPGKWLPENVIVTPGAKFALAGAIWSTVKAGGSEEAKAVLILNPAWPTFGTQTRLSGATPIFVDTIGKEVSFEMLEESGRDYNLKAIIINSPSNPTGKILKAEELKTIAEFANKYNIWVISDEIYRRISYVELAFPMAHFAPERTITISGFSKEFAMTGWRLGYAIAPKKIISEMEAWQSQTITCPSAPIQYAGLVALTHPEKGKEIEKMVREFSRRREIAAKELAKIPGLIFEKPDGAFYFFIDIRKYLIGKILTVEDLTDYLFTEAQVAVVPGTSFGSKNHIRLSFAASEKDLLEALDRIRVYLGRLKK